MHLYWEFIQKVEDHYKNEFVFLLPYLGYTPFLDLVIFLQIPASAFMAFLEVKTLSQAKFSKHR